jgi:hypothetical protein
MPQSVERGRGDAGALGEGLSMRSLAGPLLLAWVIAGATACAQADDSLDGVPQCLHPPCVDASVQHDASDTGGGSDTAVVLDSGAPKDSGNPIDSAQPVDSGALDSGALDSGALDSAVVDSNTADASMGDSTVSADSGADSGPGLDSGIDAGSDTGTAGEVGVDTGPTCTPTVGSACDLWPQCGCAPSQKCDVPLVDGVTVCMAAGSAANRQKCTGIGDCAAGQTCFGGLCEQLCGVAADCPATTPSSICAQVEYYPTGATTPTAVPGLKVCETQCDPMAPGKCGTGNGCWFVDSTTTTCISAGTGKSYGSCASDPFACAPGYECVGGDCLKACTSDLDCSLIQYCYTLTDHPMYKGTEYGVCDY